MTQKILHIQPRQTRKTTHAIVKFLENPTKTLLVANNLINVKIIVDKLGGRYIDNIISAKQLCHKLEYINNYSLIIFDEYFSHNYTKDEYYKIGSNGSNILMYSTPNKIYHSFIFNFIKRYKIDGNEINRAYSKFSEIFDIHFEKEFNELYFNFITDTDMEIIIHPIEEFLHITVNELSEMKNMLGDEEYNKAYCNKFLK